MDDIRHNLAQIQQNINIYSARYGRQQNEVTLVAVGKKHNVEKILTLAAAGQKDFGENYLQEAMDKIATCRQANAALTWHFIGHIQSRKCREIAQNFDWVHTVDSLKVARKLSDNR